MNATVEKFGKIDILVNNAGIGDFHYAITRTSDEMWQEICDVNQTGVFNCCRAALKHMEAVSGGSIVNISSIAGVFGSAGVAYSATKAAIIGITKNIAMQYAGRGIRCNAVCPGPTQWTSLNWPPEETVAKLDQEMREITGNHWNNFTPWTTREDQANAVLFFASDESKCITGQYIVVDNGKTL
jgi:NAD(P)-dependent dehydrogenase (short-subunit alcohol dehydrogenase family)